MSNNRVFNELKELYSIYNNIEICKGESSNNKYIIIKDYNDTIYKIVVDQYYPFKGPLYFFINDISLKTYLTVPIKLQKYLKILYGKDCLCCSSLLCMNNWQPLCNLKQVIDEYKNTKIIKKNILSYYLCDLIKIKYNCGFANIYEYLLYEYLYK